MPDFTEQTSPQRTGRADPGKHSEIGQVQNGQVAQLQAVTRKAGKSVTDKTNRAGKSVFVVPAGDRPVKGGGKEEMRNEETELKRCPMCGGQATLTEKPFRPFGLIFDPRDKIFAYHCSRCGHETKSGISDHSGANVAGTITTDQEARQRALTYWNAGYTREKYHEEHFKEWREAANH